MVFAARSSCTWDAKDDGLRARRLMAGVRMGAWKPGFWPRKSSFTADKYLLQPTLRRLWSIRNPDCDLPQDSESTSLITRSLR